MRMIIFYNINEEDFNLYKDALKDFDIIFKTINDNELNNTLHDIFKSNDFSYHKPSSSNQFMFFKDIDKPLLLTIYNTINNLKPYDGLIVKYTTHNSEWLIKDVIEEVSKESRLVRKLQLIKERLIMINNMAINVTKNEDIFEAFLLLKAKAEDETTLDNSIRKLDKIIEEYKNV